MRPSGQRIEGSLSLGEKGLRGGKGWARKDSLGMVVWETPHPPASLGEEWVCAEGHPPSLGGTRSPPTLTCVLTVP